MSSKSGKFGVPAATKLFVVFVVVVLLIFLLVQFNYKSLGNTTIEANGKQYYVQLWSTTDGIKLRYSEIRNDSKITTRKNRMIVNSNESDFAKLRYSIPKLSVNENKQLEIKWSTRTIEVPLEQQ